MVAVGSVYRATLDVFGEDGAPVNPATRGLTIKLPNGTDAGALVVPAPTTVGHLVFDYTTTTDGLHHGVWTLTAPNVVQPFSFYVDPATSSSVLSLDEAKAELNLDGTTDFDVELLRMLDVATEILEARVGAITQRQVEERCQGGGRALMLSQGPPLSVVSIDAWSGASAATSYAPSEVDLDVDSWLIEHHFGYRFSDDYRVVYTIGRTKVSASIRRAALMILTYLWETQRGPSQLNPVDPLDNETFSVQGRIWSVPRDVMMLLGNDEIGPMVG